MECEPKPQFDEINVGRINVVDEDGTVRLVITNTDRFPEPLMNGKSLGQRQMPSPPAGMVFYNGDGDECGGLAYGSMKTDQGYQAFFGLQVDQYKQQDIIGLGFYDNNGRRSHGLTIFERPTRPLTEFMEQVNEVGAMPEGSEKQQAMKELVAELGSERVFVGRTADGEASVQLNDSKGHPRLRMRVDANDMPHLEFLDERGEVAFSLPPKP